MEAWRDGRGEPGDATAPGRTTARLHHSVVAPAGRDHLPGGSDEPHSTIELMAGVLGTGVASAAEIAAGAGRLVRVDLGGSAVTLIAVGHDDAGPIVAVPATPARLGDLARLVAADPASARRFRLADPQMLADALAAAEAKPTRPAGLADVGACGPDTHEDGTATGGAAGLPRPALRIVGAERVAAALAAFRIASEGLGAERTLTPGQAKVLVGLATAVLAALLAAPAFSIDVAVCLAAVCFVGLAGLRAAAALTGAGTGFSPPAASLVDADLPAYTVLVPLHREGRVVPRLLPALCALDYPADKLDLKLLLEASDRATIAAVERHPLAGRFDVVVVPKVGPLTKPKALDVGLALASGDIITIYDAEDRPDADQLRRAAEAFAAGGPRLACVQARLATDHAGDTWVTAMFALEYAMLFDALLPWLARQRLPFLLGGTSNHFRKGALLAAGGWDAFNVTEDADLAVRLARRGFASTVIASTTHEEAPLEVAAWLRQRARWYKGWLQTVLVHARDPAGLWRGAGWDGFAALMLQLVGALVTVVAYPVSWVLVAGYATGLLSFGSDGSFAGDLGLALVATAFVGGQAAMALLAVAALRMRPNAIRPAALLWLPVYWWLHSFALVLAVVDLVRRPHFWAKTEHGRAERRVSG